MSKLLTQWALCFASSALLAHAQTTSSAALRPTQASGAQSASPRATVPSQDAAPGAAAPAAPLAPAEVQFPPVDLKNFTAPAPSTQTVDSFLHAVWGTDENRVWKVAAIQPDLVPGFVKVLVLVADKRQPTRLGTYQFLITPDGKHAASGELAPFGAQPFADARQTLQQRADGPARGAVGKDLEVVEFADLQCPACKAAQGTMDQLVRDFPQARVVYQNLPLVNVHPFAMQAAEVGQCVRQAKGDPAFFTYAQKVYDTQADLVSGKAEATLRAAVTASGADPAAVMTCASQPATRAAIENSIKLASELGINGTPTLVVNGRILPLAQIPYPALKSVVVFQGKLDGIAVKEQPTLSNLH